MDNKEKVIRKLVEFCKKAESDETTEERRETITNTAEEIVKLFAIPIVTCRFSKAWVGQCKEEADESGFCKEHKGVKCVSCGEQATHDCDQTMGAFVCGAPLCDDCEHTIQSNGCNSGGELPDGLGTHCKITEQVYKPWYMRD